MAVPMWTVIIKNNGGSSIFFDDLGIAVPATSQITFSDFFTYEEIADSDDLRSAVASGGNIVVNDGVTDLSATRGVWFLTFEHIKDVMDNHYTKNQLTTPGSASVDWDNLVNVPEFANLYWKDPAYARVLGFYSLAPTGAVEGDFYVDTDDDYIYKYISGMWTPVLTAGLADTRVINLSAALEDVWEYSSGMWSYSYTPSANFAILVQDDGDGKQAQYVYTVVGGNIWVKIADVDFVAGHNTLDQAYDEGGAGAGRTVTVDAGAVQLSATASGYAPLELTDLVTAPQLGLDAGQLAVVNGLLYTYDDTRGKWLSVQRVMVAFGRRGNSNNQYMNHYGGNIASSQSGLRMARNATIVSLAGQFSASSTSDLHVRKNDVAVDIATLSVAAAQGAHDNTIDVDLTAGDYLQSYIDGGASPDPMLIVEVAWRV
jgi:hypothetical protein